MPPLKVSGAWCWCAAACRNNGQRGPGVDGGRGVEAAGAVQLQGAAVDRGGAGVGDVAAD